MTLKRIESLYREYISFANQVYFPYVTAQDQGIEMYNILMKQFDSKDKVKDLDGEIDELYQFITLLNERKQNDTSRWLNVIATLLLPITVVAALYGMNDWTEPMNDGLRVSIFCMVVAIVAYIIYIYRRNIFRGRNK